MRVVRSVRAKRFGRFLLPADWYSIALPLLYIRYERSFSKGPEARMQEKLCNHLLSLPGEMVLAPFSAFVYKDGTATFPHGVPMMAKVEDAA
jgi:hypothetical protein